MKTEVVLTVAESKRLIAKGVANLGYVQDKLQDGIVVVTSGSTNGYLWEELTGASIDKRAYITGRTIPAKGAPKWHVDMLPDLVLVNGQPDPSLDRFSCLEKMKPGDVYVKGANALNYTLGTAGIAIGHPTGGTIGGAIGSIIARKFRLLIPVGLEKEIPFEIDMASRIIADPDEKKGAINSLWPVRGDIFTEIEAFDTLCGVDAIPVGAGGIAGAEGGMRFLLMGEPEGIQAARDLVFSIQGEPQLI